MPDPPTAASRYNHTASFYEALSGAYSLGKIRASKQAELRFVHPGDRVLFAGAGGGEDAVGAAGLGARVTCVDLAPAMIERTRRKFDDRGLDAELICGDIMDHSPEEAYDAVCTNYLLNVFDPPTMRAVLEHLVSLARPGGLLMFADFAVPRGGPFTRRVHALYNWVANATFWVLSRNPIHPVYDVEQLATEHGLTSREVFTHRLFPRGPGYFQTTITSKDGGTPG